MLMRRYARQLCFTGVVVLAAAAALLLLYAVYVEAGGPQQDRVARARACLLCHAGDQPVPGVSLLKGLRPGESLRERVLARVVQVHPVLSKGVEAEVADMLVSRLLPLLAQERAGAPGHDLYVAKCAACHGRDGLGTPGEYPPLRGSEWLTQEPNRLHEILTQGLSGPITVRGVAWDKTMRAPGLTPQEVQQVVEFLRRVWAGR